MKSMKKLMALLLVVIMMLALGTTAFAAGSGSITVTGTTSGKTYDLYKIFDLTGKDTSSPADGTYDQVAYTIDTDWVNFFFGTNAPGAGYLLTAQPSGGSLNSLTYNGTVYYINITESSVAAFAQDALAWCADNSPAADKTDTASGESLAFTGLDLGYYLVYPQGATDIKSGNASICSLTSTKPSNQVNVKATYPDITKVVDDPSVEVGQTVTFTITGQVPYTTGYTSYTYEVKDTMTSGLTFNTTVDNIKVEFGDTTIAVEGSGVAQGTSYTVANNGFDLVFDMTKYQGYKGKAITITYSAVVNDAAVVTLTENHATLTYNNDPSNLNSKTTTPPQEVQVYSSKIVVDKYDGGDSTKATKLQGAEFVLVKKSGSGESATESFYNYTAASGSNAAMVNWETDITKATVRITDQNGAAEFAGLEDGTYYLRETKSPTGFNLLTTDTEVTVTHTQTTATPAEPIGVSVKAEVANNAGTLLPETGGFGTTMLIVLGSVLFMATAIVLVTKKRMYNEG